MSHNYALLLAGGQGTRFWPQSRTLEPKQFLSLHKNKSLFEQTILRVKPLVPVSQIYIATSELYRHQTLELADAYGIPRQNLIFEPDGRNTAPSIAVSCRLIQQRDPASRICVLPCDHLVRNEKEFIRLLKNGLSICDRSLVIFGIAPHRPATGYGYIQAGKGSQGVYRVKRFTEKPDMKTAQRFLARGDYYWNSGIFVGSGRVFQEAFLRCLPKLADLTRKINAPEEIMRIWRKIEPISFDYGVLEKSSDLLMLAARRDLGWSDLGSWQAWDEMISKDRDGNILKADVVNIGSRNITVVGAKRLIAAIGLEDLIIVDTPDALLVTRKDQSEQVKNVVDQLKQDKRQEHYTHKTVKRPWGSYTVLDMGEGFKVKLVEVKPKQCLSLQYHKKRSEHWVVVEGTAKIVKGKKAYTFSANESTYIPIGCTHRLANPSDCLPLKIVEVQAGKYLEEDDIVRLKDDFGRA